MTLFFFLYTLLFSSMILAESLTKSMKQKLKFYLIVSVACIGLWSCNDDPLADHPNDERSNLAKTLLELPLEQRVSFFGNIDHLFYTHTIPKGSTITVLPRKEDSFTEFRYSTGSNTSFTIDDFMARNLVTGLLVIKDGSIRLERYGMGNNEQTRWSSFSVAKSFTSTLVGMAVREGSLELDEPVKTYLPDFNGTAFGEAHIRHLLQMSSGIDWEEDYYMPDSSFKILFEYIADGESAAIREQLKQLPARCAPGIRFNYSTGDTTLLGLVLQAVLGKERLTDYLSRKVWSHIGMESDGYWIIDGQDGTAWGGGCISMTLRDEGRFGLFLLNGGLIDGVPQLPDQWSQSAYQPATNAPHLAYGNLYEAINGYEDPSAYPLGYGYGWWCLPPTWTAWDELESTEVWGDRIIPQPRSDFHHLNSFTALGVFGQYLHINPQSHQVTVIWSAWDDAEHDPMDFETLCFIEDITAFLASQDR